jgi:hypothetical protein
MKSPVGQTSSAQSLFSSRLLFTPSPVAVIDGFSNTNLPQEPYVATPTIEPLPLIIWAIEVHKLAPRCYLEL